MRILRRLSRQRALLVVVLGWLVTGGRKHKRFLLGALCVAVVAGIVAELTLEPRHLPWHPLAIDDRAGFSTDLKLTVIGLGPASWCDRLLDRSSNLQKTVLPAHDGAGSCGWESAVHIDSSSGVTLTGGSPVAMQCKLAAGAHIWLTSVDLRAREILGSSLKRIHHAGTYSCRRMYNRSSGPMSQHAYANAWDVTGFELADGRVVSVLKHWNATGPLQDFLHAVQDDACRIFGIVLGPDYNAAHRDHFHLDMGIGMRCG